MNEQIDIFRGSSDPDVAPEIQMLRLASGHISAQAVRVFASLGIADHLRAGPKTTEEIADLVEAHAPTLHRVLRFLSTIGVVCEQEDGRFALTSLGRTLCSQGLSVIKHNAMLTSTSYYWSSLGGLIDQVIAGENTTHSASFFEYLSDHPKDAAQFSAAMDSLTRANVPAILAAYDFSSFKRIVDVGGGRGALLTGILKRYPSIRGVLYDSAIVVDSMAVDRTVADRLERVAGNFFESVPAGGDAYILKQVLHNWDDNKAIHILRQCRGAMLESATLLVIEMAAPEERNSGNNWAALDMLMMLMKGRERTVVEVGQILGAAGFAVGSISSTVSPLNVLNIVEATPA